jgi:hypothetical protein
MELRRELLLGIGALVVLNMLLAFVAIGLFVRMGPAIEHILEENVYSIIAAEEMLAELAEAGGAPVSAEARQRILEALERAKSNVTESDEVPVLRAIEQELAAALEGDAQARVAVVRQTGTLIRINRAAMHKVDGEAQRLGDAGAWTAVLVGFLSFFLSLVVVRRLRHRLLAPLVELHQVLEAVRHGEKLHRCRAREAPAEVRQVLESVNMLLDERLSARAAGEVSPEDAALLLFLDRQPRATMVIDREGRVVRASAAALEVLAGDRGKELKQALSALAATGGATDSTIEAIELRGGVGWLCIVAASWTEARG